MIIDTHCHVSGRWYEPVDVLLDQMDRHGVERAWLIQLLGNYDNAYQQDACLRHADRFVSFVGIDWSQPNALEAVASFADAGATGVRLRVTARSPGDDPYAIWRAVAARKMVVSCLGTAAQFADPAFAALITECPDLRCVLEHLGGLARPDVGDLALAMPAILALSQHPQVSLKMPGLGQMLTRERLGPDGAEAAALGETPLLPALATFGASRLMWGSDFPVVSTREGYGNALAWTRAALPQMDRALMFGEAAHALMAEYAN